MQALAIAACFQEDWPLLIISPSSMRLQWANELEKWYDMVTPDEIDVVLSGKATSLRGKIAIVSYQLVHRYCTFSLSLLMSLSAQKTFLAYSLAQVIEQKRFGVVILDESHSIKSFSAQRTKAVMPIVQRAKRAIMLSGTPAVSRPSELFTQLVSLQPKLIPAFREYGARYCAPAPNPYTGYIEYNGSDNLEELYSLLTETVMIRRLKAQVLSQLPAKKRHKVRFLNAKYIKKPSKTLI